MKKILCIVVMAVVAVFSTSLINASDSSNKVKGVVIYDAKSDYHIVETDRYYVIVEWYAGPDFSEGDIIYGDLHSYNFKMVKVNNNSSETKVYVENFWGNKERCMEWLREHDKI